MDGGRKQPRGKADAKNQTNRKKVRLEQRSNKSLGNSSKLASRSPIRRIVFTVHAASCYDELGARLSQTNTPEDDRLDTALSPPC